MMTRESGKLAYSHEGRAWGWGGPGRRNMLGAVLLKVIVAVVVLATAGGVLYTVNQGRSSSRAYVDDMICKAPKNTCVFVAGDMGTWGIDPQVVQSMLNIMMSSSEALNADKLPQEAPEGVKEGMREKAAAVSQGFDIFNEVFPWLGERFTFILAMDERADGTLKLSQAGAPVPSLCVAGVKVRDEEKALASMQKMMAKFSADTGVKYVTEDFSGHTLHFAEDESAPAWCLDAQQLCLGMRSADLRYFLGESESQVSLNDNTRFQQARAKVVNSQGGLAYLDINRLVKTFASNRNYPWLEKEMGQLVRAGQYFALGLGRSDKSLDVRAFLAVDSANSGELGKKLFNTSYNLDFQSVKFHSGDAEFLGAVNIRWLLEWFREIAASTPQGAFLALMPETALAKLNLKWDQDIWSAIKGELAFSSRGMGTAQAEQLACLQASGKEDDNGLSSWVSTYSKVPMLISLSICGRTPLEQLVAKVPFLTFLTSKAEAETVGNTTLFPLSLSEDCEACLAYNDQAVLFGVNNGLQSVRQVAEAVPGDVFEAKRLNGIPARGVIFVAQDLGTYYTQMAQSLQKSGAVSPEISALLEKLGQMYGLSTLSVSLEEGGLAVNHALRFK